MTFNPLLGKLPRRAGTADLQIIPDSRVELNPPLHLLQRFVYHDRSRAGAAEMFPRVAP
jgi:hypothetical protein